jgi:hypothetical protein
MDKKTSVIITGVISFVYWFTPVFINNLSHTYNVDPFYDFGGLLFPSVILYQTLSVGSDSLATLGQLVALGFSWFTLHLILFGIFSKQKVDNSGEIPD